MLSNKSKISRLRIYAKKIPRNSKFKILSAFCGMEFCKNFRQYGVALRKILI